MARLGLLADIHGNLEALSRALGVLDAARVDGLVCLGDMVGYHPDGDACLARLEKRGALCIAGNHDLIAAGALDSNRCGLKAQHALARARRDLGGKAARILLGLPRHRLLEGGVACIHGGVDDVCEYMTSEERIATNARRLTNLYPSARACLFGHTHVRAVYVVHDSGVVREPAVGTVSLSRPSAVVFVNPGSVDAARRRGARAELAVLDTERRELTFLDVGYDDAGTERRARAFGYRRPNVPAWLDRPFAKLRGALRFGWAGKGAP